MSVIDRWLGIWDTRQTFINEDNVKLFQDIPNVMDNSINAEVRKNPKIFTCAKSSPFFSKFKSAHIQMDSEEEKSYIHFVYEESNKNVNLSVPFYICWDKDNMNGLGVYLHGDVIPSEEISIEEFERRFINHYGYEFNINQTHFLIKFPEYFIKTFFSSFHVYDVFFIRLMILLQIREMTFKLQSQ